MNPDHAFLARLASAVDADVAATLGLDPAEAMAASALGPHRESMRRAKLLVAAYLCGGGGHRGKAELLALAGRYASALAELQVSSGLFAGGDNVESPPDSGFTLNDVGDTLELLRRVADPAADPARRTLMRVLERARPALLDGGAQTPNHRWELAAALARMHRLLPDDQLLRRARQWLDEGVDLMGDGQYSERSANYAAYVSNPSLLVLGDALGRPDLHDVVERNLSSFLGLIHPDASVETVHSRRQDQKNPAFPLAPFLWLYRRMAVERGRADFAWAAERAEEGGIVEAHTVLAEALLHPSTASSLPRPGALSYGRTRWASSGLQIDANARRRLVLYGGSDYRGHRRIRSGLANNPTFLRLFGGDAVLESARLSRDFFSLGPFRADSATDAGDAVELVEDVQGSYYQPLAPACLRADGAYALADDGRFSGAMSFAERAHDDIHLRTRLTLLPTPDGVEVRADVEGPRLAWALELAFRPGGRFEGDGLREGENLVLESGTARYVAGRDAVEFGPGTGMGGTLRYQPGEDYGYLGGTDALTGPRAYLTGRSPGSARFVLRRVEA